MSNGVSGVLDTTLQKIRDMIDANTVMGTPVTTPDGTTIIPVTKISVGFGGGGSDFNGKNPSKEPFGGGAGGGVKVTPVAFLVLQNGSVRMIPVAHPANTTADRLVEMIPDTLDKVSAFIDSHTKKGE